MDKSFDALVNFIAHSPLNWVSCLKTINIVKSSFLSCGSLKKILELGTCKPFSVRSDQYEFFDQEPNFQSLS